DGLHLPPPLQCFPMPHAWAALASPTCQMCPLHMHGGTLPPPLATWINWPPTLHLPPPLACSLLPHACCTCLPHLA
ncbi:hypothetical protein L9F63_027535, partial [Diploptera punctata]